MVSVAPEVSSSAVLMVGSQNGPIVWKGSTMPAGEAVAPPPALGHTALKSGHSTWWFRSPSIGSANTRAQYRAPKKAAKNITSEKMNQLMLQRKDTSTRSEYRPPSLSPMAWRNHWKSTVSHTATPASSTQAPHGVWLTHCEAPKMTSSMPSASTAGWREGAGMK